MSPAFSALHDGPTAAGSVAIPEVVAAITRRVPDGSSASPSTSVLGKPALAADQVVAPLGSRKTPSP